MLMAFKIKKKMIKNLFDLINDEKISLELTGLQGSEKAYLTALLFEKSNRSMVVVLPTHKEVLRFMEDLSFFMPGDNEAVLYFPGYHILPYKALSYHGETAAQRVAVLYQLMEKRRHYIVVTCLDTLLQKVIPGNMISETADLVINGEEIDRDLLIARLDSGGYQRTSLVEEKGDYSVRGGILDLFSPNYKTPVRIELFGDYVESLRHFSPISQRGIAEMEEAVIIPSCEAVLTAKELPMILGRLRQAGAAADVDRSKIKEYVGKIKNEGRFPGMESMLSILYPELDTFFDYMPEDALFLMDNPDSLRDRAEKFIHTARENYENALKDRRLCVSPESIYLEWKAFFSNAASYCSVQFKAFDLSRPHELDSAAPDGKKNIYSAFKNNAALSSQIKRDSVKEHLLQPLADWFIEKKASGARVAAVCTSDVQAHRLCTLLQPYGIELTGLKEFNSFCISPAGMYYVLGNLSSGFVLPESGIALITDQEIFGVRKRVRKRTKKGIKDSFITPEELKQGDVIVHVEHGLGRYDGLRTIKMGGISGDFILITYRDDDRLYLPVDRMEMIEKYVGVEGYSPLLDKIGGKTFGKARAKARKEVEKMAGDLLKIYAERRVNKGYAFSPPDTYYADFEASFPYNETPDQQKVIDEVLTDMESDVPMDRLVCGDVGYGKTEVAIRAAFKAVNDGKQVAVVVPTTILAEQHQQTFSRRFQDYPVSVGSLSRFRTLKEQKTILKELENGGLDIVIGTHRLLQKDVSFKSLGLLVIDEEQRFGVKHKERLKTKRTTVDVLALTATPIPRTLHMSLTGMRDISVITTAPAERRAIVSYISEYDDSVAADAIRRELARAGQIFFIHNEIKSIFKMADKLRKLVPQVRIGVAHGRLSESHLEKVMFQFVNREIDMLVCTTIVESGLDIPSANTMIINRADRFGLAQIYQLRGRIGRGGDQAYAYLFVPDENRLTRDAKKRLAALMEHRDLGSGFQIAMKDLQIRGSGSALGASQSGHIAAVGYDMFLKLLDEAVSALKGKPMVPPLEPEINVSMSAHISEAYVQSIEQRLTLYRRLSQMTRLSEISAMQKELADRFGPLPEEATNMLLKIMLRVLAVKAGVKMMDITPSEIIMVFSGLHQKRPFVPEVVWDAAPGGYEFTAENVLKVNLGVKNKKISKALAVTKKILQEIGLHVQGN